MHLRIDEELRNWLPELKDDESEGLEKRVLAEGIRDPLVVWKGKGVIVDGHHRYEIAQAHGLEFEVVEIDFANKEAAKVWMIDNQKARRNLTPAMRLELGEKKAEVLKPKAEENKAHGQTAPGRTLSQKSDKAFEPVDTLKEAADYAGVSRDTASKWRYVRQHAPETVKEQTLKGDVSINAAYSKTRQEQRRKEQYEHLDMISSKEAAPVSGTYDIIVIDPPWPMKKIEREVAPEQVAFDYPTMNEQQLRELPVPAAENCHMWLWTTHKFMPMAFRLIEHWGFKYICAFVWHKPGGFQPYNLPQFNCEFALYAHKGNPFFVETKQFFTAFNAPRGKHSEKPEEFYDMVRRVTAGRRLDMFARREREGFDVWGNEV